MKPASIFINQEKGLLRSGWRVTIFFVLLLLPQFLPVRLFGGGGESAGSDSRFGFDIWMVLTYVMLNGWVILISWLCLRMLERLGLGRLGFGFFRRWWRDLLLGILVATAMMCAIVLLQMIGGGTRLMLNPLFWQTVDGARATDWPGIMLLLAGSGRVLLVFIFAGAFEELLCRGYAFQTLLRDVPAIVPIAILSLIFGLLHVGNPNATAFGIANTMLAGIWLSVAYIKTRGLWFPTALHFMWNWMMGSFFGLPVSGLRLETSASVFIAANEAPVWLTGGNYGPEGGVATTLVLIVATVIIWRADWLSSAEEELPASEDSGLILPDLRTESPEDAR